MISKVNVLDFLVFPAWFASKGIIKLLAVPEAYHIEARVMYTIISWLLGRVQDYLARELRLNLNSAWQKRIKSA